MAKSDRVVRTGTSSRPARRRASASAGTNGNGHGKRANMTQLVTLQYLKDYGRDEVSSTTVPDLGNRTIYYLPKRVASISFAKFFDAGEIGKRSAHAIHIIYSILCNADGSPMFESEQQVEEIPLDALSSIVLAVVNHRMQGFVAESASVGEGGAAKGN